ncbi:VOC family protein [Actinotalea sp. K2]|uniref:VOC family protein n=1 Tax=Actinotalea sp. K2 TaxID=2939438 RepID=UPI002018201D|nr:VOC family protein [Actinotalea sp. K2]MCL3860497.1 4a-hydroxytetrahydrobiopterin dehydratase [Actinotalea sp. K2]
MSDLLRDSEVTDALDPRHWRVVLGRVHGTFRTGTFTCGLELTQRVAEVAEALNHHPDVDLRYGSVHLSTVSHDVGGLTGRDVALAGAVSAVVDELGIKADTTAPQALEVAIDALDIPAVVPFWRAVLGYAEEVPVAEDSSPALVDPAGIGPALWFQQMDAPRPQRNRIHLDVSVPHDVAEQRVAAAVAAGGTLVSDERAPAFWVLADVEGNEACVCTWQARD